jgi:hypothetical protein
MLAVPLLLAARTAGATLSAERVPDVDPCVLADSYFPEDQSPEAARARRRCRMAKLERAQAEQEAWAETADRQRQERALAAWTQKAGIPNRVMRRNSIDGLVGSGIVSYGVAVGGIIVPSLEAELWLGRATDPQVITYTDNPGVGNKRNCLGGRAKWLMLDYNVTPFFGIGVAGCLATLDPPYRIDPNSGNLISTSGGSGAAHFVTGSVGLTWTEKSGFRLSAEYIFSYAFYTQAQDSAPPQTQDEILRQAWETQLAGTRHGIRLQVGYAF